MYISIVSSYNKKDLKIYYGITYFIVAILETILFTVIGGTYTFRDIVVNFSIWGIVWLVTCFTYPLFIVDADPSMLALPGWVALFGYVIIIVAYYVAYRLHKRYVEKREGKQVSFVQILDLYFPATPQE